MEQAQRAALRTIIPGKLYQRGQFLTWPYNQKHRLLREHGITFVVNLWHKIDPDLSSSQLGWLYLNWLCSPSHVPPAADLMTNFVTLALEDGHRVLVHCEAGRGRSVWFVTRVLATYRNIPGPAALAEVETSVPNHNLRSDLREDLLSI